MRRSLLRVSAVAFGLVAAASVPAAAGPIGLLPGPGSIAMVSATSSVPAPGIERVVFLLNGGSGFSGIWSGGGGASICIGCFVSPSGWDGGSNTFGFGGPAGFGGGTSAGTGGAGFGGGTSAGTGGNSGFNGLVTLPALIPPMSGNSFTLPFELFGTLNGYNVFGQGQLLFTTGGVGGLATGAPFQSSEAPEPASLVLLSTGASALLLAARRRRKDARS